MTTEAIGKLENDYIRICPNVAIKYFLYAMASTIKLSCRKVQRSQMYKRFEVWANWKFISAHLKVSRVLYLCCVYIQKSEVIAQTANQFTLKLIFRFLSHSIISNFLSSEFCCLKDKHLSKVQISIQRNIFGI